MDGEDYDRKSYDEARQSSWACYPDVGPYLWSTVGTTFALIGSKFLSAWEQLDLNNLNFKIRCQFQ